MKEWKVPKRNWKGIQFEKLRRKVDPLFNEAHDVLSKAYYEGKPFIWKGKDWGILNKELFDKLHGLIFELRMVGFHQANMKQTSQERIPEEKYNYLYDGETGNITGKKSDEAAQFIARLKAEDIELEI